MGFDEQLSEAAGNEAQTRLLRQTEQQVARLTSALRIEKTARKQAEVELAQLRERQDLIESIGPPQAQEWNARSFKSAGPATAVLVLSDWHVGARVDPRTVNGLNETSLAIMEKRIKCTFQRACRIIEVAQHLSKIKELVVALIGDFISGYIHEELVESNLLSPGQELQFARDQIVSGFDYLFRNSGFNKLRVVTNYGNHGRTTQKKRVSTGGQNSFEQIMYESLATIYRRDRRFTWHVATGYHNIVPIQNKIVRFHHGDEIRYNGGVGGITIPVNKAISAWNRSGIHADLDVFGHYHQFLNGGHWICNNCLVGYDAYALSIKADFSRPSQTLFVMDQSRPRPVFVAEVFSD